MKKNAILAVMFSVFYLPFYIIFALTKGYK